ncbi:EAL domain-containing protein [uncultured Deefgea sp.]|uniref:EAL domain-containing protein n=1 Tax=uncultured Deefgea sp. TaxID=1304914 RepID=UPI002612820F|nr:EAL domain-containing protein [uncultured Deefgea sp.]
MHSFFATPMFGRAKVFRVLLIAACNLSFIALVALLLWQVASYQSRQSIQLLTERGASMIEQSLRNAYTVLDQIALAPAEPCQAIYADLQKISAATPYFRAIYIADSQTQRIFCSSAHALGKIDSPIQTLISDGATQASGIAWHEKSLISDREALIIYRKLDNGRVLIGVLDSQYYKDILQLVMGLRVKTITLRVGDLQLVNQGNDFILMPFTAAKNNSTAISMDQLPVSVTAQHNHFQLRKYIETNLPLAILLSVLFLAWSSRWIWLRFGENNHFRQHVIESIQQQQFKPYYQPVMGQQNAICAVEILARWQHPQHGLLTPALFIQQAEAQGLLTPMMLSIIEQVEIDLSTKPIPAQSRVGINITAQQLNDQSMLNAIFALNAKLKYLDYQLVVELTEEGLVSDPDLANKIITEIGQAGIMVAIDDFGIGHSSLASLSRFPFHYLKIDKSFIDHIVSREKDQIIVANMVDMAKKLNLNIVAEGVENKDQADYLAILGIDYLQGFYFSKPLPIAELSVFQFNTENTAQFPYFH